MSSELANKSVTAAKWGVISTAAKFVLQLAVNVAVARLLGPDSYGLFALGTLVLMLATFFSDFGLGWGLMQRQHITDEQVRFVFTWQTLSGLFGALVLITAAPLIAGFMRDPRLVDVVRWLALTCLLNGMASTANNLLRRELRFKDIAVVQIQSYLVAYGLFGLPMAALGCGVWSLVTAWIMQSLAQLLLSLRARPHALKPLPTIEQPREFINTGAVVFLTNVCNWMLLNIDRLLLGRIVSTHAAGLYAVGYNLASVPNSLLISALQPAFLASGAKLQDDRQRLRRAYLEIQSFVWIVIAPLFALLALSGRDIIALLYGPAWVESGPVFGLLVLAMPLYLAWAMSTPVLWNTGRRRQEVMLQLPVLLLAVPALAWAAGAGVAFVAAVAAAVFALRFVAMAVPVCRALAVSCRDVLALIGRSVVVNCGVAGLALLAGQVGEAVTRHDALLMTFRTVVGGLVLAMLLLAVPRLMGQHAASLLLRFVPQRLRESGPLSGLLARQLARRP
ncbi:lipopolysaccharide biosynthesis protein [Roseateles sp.]|uniref:lipopolysaccharide biosynthesis protein n=1 Tax=Roseateles sp. TaxID=1971397 RepID=UPI0025CB8AED|nr:lipopolysaccharide biosynthesis protein [Roseateles sp.]MBV8033892.1 lipopolysaccharide biosynthesis protein [Roseateles sp.]